MARVQVYRVLVECFDMNDIAVRQQHDRLARVYDRRRSRYISRTLALLRTWASIPPQAAVLDIGCGTGEFERLVLSEQPEQRMVGVDLSVKMFAREKCQAYPNVTFCAASSSALPFPAHSFDMVVSASALHYFDRPEVSLREMRRVVRLADQL